MKTNHSNSMPNILFWIFITLSIFPCFNSHADTSLDDTNTTLVKANELYRNGDFKTATYYYRQVISQGANNGHIYYNLGNSLYRLGYIGKAIAAYKKALLEFPRNPDIKANLDLARSKAEDKLTDNQQQAVSINRLLFLSQYFSRYELKIGLLLSLVIFSITYVLLPINQIIFARSFLIVSFIFCFGFGSSLLFSRIGRDGNPVFAFSPSSHRLANGVIIKSEVSVYSGNSTNYQVVFLLHDGAEVEIGEIRDNWVQISLPDGRQGWIKEESIDII